ncbi:MAG: AmmeMemoRadiSam system radical SAM enzyme [Bacteroidales bacterium]
MSPEEEKLSKREFIRKSLLGVGGMYCCPFLLGENSGQNINIRAGKPWKWSREAMHYISTPRGIKCRTCPNECDIKEGEAGDCRTKEVVDGKLYTIAYGNPCSVNIDPMEKKPLHHFHPGTRVLSIATAGCNLACLNCQNWEISQRSPRETRNYDLMPPKVVELAIQENCPSIAYTYSDPVAFYEYTLDTSTLARQAGLSNVIVSAGFISPRPLKDWCRVIDAANIDLKSFSDDIYAMLNAGKLQPVLDTLLTLKEEGVWLEITNLIVPTWTDDMKMIGEMCRWLVKNGFSDTPLHFSRFQPMYKLNRLAPTPVSTLDQARKTALNEGMHFVYVGNVPGHPAQDTLCPNCGKTLVVRKGYQVTMPLLKNGKCASCGQPIPGVWD